MNDLVTNTFSTTSAMTTLLRPTDVQTTVTSSAANVSLDDEQTFAKSLEKARENMTDLAEKLVSGTLITPLLKQIRNDPFKSDLFHGGQAEEAFGAQLDQHLADRMSSTGSMPLTRTLADHFVGWLGNDAAKISKVANTRVNIVG